MVLLHAADATITLL